MPIKSNASDNNTKDNDNNNIAKAAGFVVFSGIALSILKTLNPYKNNTTTSTAAAITTTATSQESNQPLETYPKPISYQEPIIKKPKAKVVVATDASTTTPPPTTTASTSSSGGRSVVIAKGDTLWGLSNKYGVSVDAIKEANGLTGNTIYAGKKLVIP